MPSLHVPHRPWEGLAELFTTFCAEWVMSPKGSDEPWRILPNKRGRGVGLPNVSRNPTDWNLSLKATNGCPLKNPRNVTRVLKSPQHTSVFLN